MYCFKYYFFKTAYYKKGQLSIEMYKKWINYVIKIRMQSE